MRLCEPASCSQSPKNRDFLRIYGFRADLSVLCSRLTVLDWSTQETHPCVRKFRKHTKLPTDIKLFTFYLINHAEFVSAPSHDPGEVFTCSPNIQSHLLQI